MKLVKLKIAQEVRLTILDHAKGPYPMPDAPSFDVYGKIVDINPVTVTVAHWVDPAGQLDTNTELAILLRSAITKVKVFR
jgi:hypothetical protein